MLLETTRLTLRPFQESDAEAVFLYARDPEMGPAAGWPPHQSVSDSLFVIQNVLNGPECYAVCLKDTDEVIGAIELIPYGKSRKCKGEKECELGFWLGKPFWGNGYIPEAAREMLRHGFIDLGLERIWCSHYTGNEKSKRVQQKLGFRFYHFNPRVKVPLLHETRSSFVNVLYKEQWLMAFTARELTVKEVPEANALAWSVFTVYESPDYASEGRTEFRKTLLDREYPHDLTYLGAFDGDRLVGMLTVRRSDSHLCMFYVDVRYHRIGVGKLLFESLKRAFPGQSITCNASPYGKPFLLALGFTELDSERTDGGVHYTPMVWIHPDPDYRIINIEVRPDLKEKAAKWFADKWGIPEAAYLESIEASYHITVPSWYLCLNGERIVAGVGVIENDFHPRKDLTPNVCAVYTDPYFRHQGIAGEMLDYVCYDMHTHGIDTLYLLTDHTNLYERYHWDFLCLVTADGEEEPSRMYVHHYGV